MEKWDLYDEQGRPSGRSVVRGEPIPKGFCHLVSDILVRHTDGEYLLMQRDFGKPNYGGYFEMSAGGSALMGEDALTCAKRELREETGIICENLLEIGRSTSHHTIYVSFLCTTDWDKSAITLLEGETISYRWVTEEDFLAFIASDDAIPSQKKRYENYFRKMEYIR